MFFKYHVTFCRVLVKWLRLMGGCIYFFFWILIELSIAGKCIVLGLILWNMKILMVIFKCSIGNTPNHEQLAKCVVNDIKTTNYSNIYVIHVITWTVWYISSSSLYICFDCRVHKFYKEGQNRKLNDDKKIWFIILFLINLLTNWYVEKSRTELGTF